MAVVFKTTKSYIPKAILISVICSFLFWGCRGNNTGKESSLPSILNLDHLDYLGEVVLINGQKIRLIHIYAEAPDYHWVGDPDEGVSCVDDVARATVVYLRHFELTGDERSAEKAKQLLRFVLYMQTEEGLFNNFVYSNKLDKNTTHRNSVADRMNWWAGRAVWALGSGVKTLIDYDSSFAKICLTAIDKTIPHIEETLSSYPKTKIVNGYKMPTWLIGETSSDASSELLMGLASANKAAPNVKYQSAIEKISEGISMIQYGSISQAPYGAHISWEGGWHGWGNSQTMALVDAGFPESAVVEGTNFYPWMLVNGWMHSFELSNPSKKQYYEQIAYAVRCVTVGLIRLYEKTGNEDYAVLAGLAASWFTGNNVTGIKMYNPQYGYGYDGINNSNTINYNSGAESTIEALMSILEVEQYPSARKWMMANSVETRNLKKDEKNYTFKVFETQFNGATEQVALVLNTTDSSYLLMDKAQFNGFINN